MKEDGSWWQNSNIYLPTKTYERKFHKGAINNRVEEVSGTNTDKARDFQYFFKGGSLKSADSGSSGLLPRQITHAMMTSFLSYQHNPKKRTQTEYCGPPKNIWVYLSWSQEPK